MCSFAPRWIVFFKGPVCFVAKFSQIELALDACIRAKAGGYKATIKSLPH